MSLFLFFLVQGLAATSACGSSCTFLLTLFSLFSFEPQHDKTKYMAGAPSEAADQPGHPSSDQSSLCVQWVANDPMLLHADSEDSDQTGRMPGLI